MKTRPSSLTVIAEVNTSHFGEIKEAERVIEKAAALGAAAVKFQSWAPESLFTAEYLSSHSIEHRLYEKFALSKDELLHLRNFAKREDLMFGSTAYSVDEVDSLVDIGADFVKIASMDIVSPPILTAAAQTNLPTIISTGMASKEEIGKAVTIFERNGSVERLSVLHCTSIYPTPIRDSSLSSLTWLQEEFRGIEVGFSDHTTGVVAAAAALGRGVRLFEKHFTLSKSRPGFDNQMAEDESDFSLYVSALEDLVLSMESEAKTVLAAEAEQSQKMRRSAHLLTDLSAGALVTLDNVEFKRPGNGISYYDLESLPNSRLIEGKKRGSVLTFDDFKER